MHWLTNGAALSVGRERAGERTRARAEARGSWASRRVRARGKRGSAQGKERASGPSRRWGELGRGAGLTGKKQGGEGWVACGFGLVFLPLFFFLLFYSLSFFKLNSNLI